MSSFRRGDVVSLSRPQTSKLTVLTPPSTDGELYSVTLPIDPTEKTFSVASTLGQTTADLAAALLEVLLREQTAYSPAIDSEAPTEIVLVGRLGEAFAITTTDNLTPTLLVPAVLAIDHRTGEPIGPIRLLEVTDTLERAREFFTRDRDGNVQTKNQLQGREIGSSNVFDFDASQVLTVLHTEGR